jgi:glycosyltransferase involved in cell wall biosynthesis
VDNDNLPSVSIVVPNFNSGHTLTRCLDSLLAQNYPRLEIIVVDGGSTDGSVAVIERYASQLASWVSEPDRGQSHALNKGIAKAQGQVVNWLCSDDFLLPGALHAIGREFARDASADVVVGAGEIRKPSAAPYLAAPTVSALELMPCHNPIVQPACFFKRHLLCRDPVIDESFSYAMDFELWNYFKTTVNARFNCISDVLAVFPMDGDNKTSTGGQRIIAEVERVYRRYCRERVPLTYWHGRLRAPLERLRKQYGVAGYLIARPLQVVTVLSLAPFYGLARVRAMNWAPFQ